MPRPAEPHCATHHIDQRSQKADRHDIERAGNIPAPSNHARRWSGWCIGNRDVRPANGPVQARSRFCGMAWPGAEAKLQRWKTASRQNIENGPARYSPSPGDRCNGCRELGFAKGRSGRYMACAHVVTETAHACCHGFGWQNGSWDLGHAYEARGLQESGIGGCRLII